MNPRLYLAAVVLLSLSSRSDGAQMSFEQTWAGGGAGVWSDAPITVSPQGWWWDGWRWVPPSVPNPGPALQGHPLSPNWAGNGGCPPGTRPGTIWGGGGWQADGQCHVTVPHGGFAPRPMVPVLPFPHQAWPPHQDGAFPHGGGQAPDHPFPARPAQPWRP